ncbi:hypothetical protein GGR54DRAFT_427730 [Hypoxylon sp. NC1633]|nr:hypothetical protein GGR54DRAFT_427730 [Hypoxylon sp. NC1633]
MSAETLPGVTTTLDGPLPDDYHGVPLLTTFTAAESCLNNWIYDVSTSGTVWKDRVYNTDYPIDCLPFGGRNTIYKPGVCPSGQEFQQLDATIGTNEASGTSTLATLFVGYCCSSGFKLSYRDHYTQYMNCFSGLLPPIYATPKTGTTPIDRSETVQLISPLVAVEEPVSIYWEESDLTYFPASVANSLRGIMGIPTATSTSSVSAMTPAPSPGSSGNPALSTPTAISEDSGRPATGASTNRAVLPPGAIAGICVGVVAFLVLLGTICYLTCVRRRRKRRAAVYNATGEIQGEGNGNGNWMSELQDTQTGSRLDPFYIAQRHSELPGNTQAPVELEGSPIEGPGGSNNRLDGPLIEKKGS